MGRAVARNAATRRRITHIRSRKAIRGWSGGAQLLLGRGSQQPVRQIDIVLRPLQEGVLEQLTRAQPGTGVLV